MRVWTLTLVLLIAPVVLRAQELTPEALLKPDTDSWPTYNGDYSGQRHSPLHQINASNVASLSALWTQHSRLDCWTGAEPDSPALAT